jgi:hypothetical protein
MKKVVSGGPVRAVAFPQADAGLPDTTFFISVPARPVGSGPDRSTGASHHATLRPSVGGGCRDGNPLMRRTISEKNGKI